MVGVYSVYPVTNITFKQRNDNKVSKPSGKTSLSNTSKAMIGLSALGTIGAAVVAVRSKKVEPLKREILTFSDFLRESAEFRQHTPQEIAKNCIPENFLGSGQNSTVYKFSHPQMNKWAIKIDTIYGDAQESFNHPIREVVDEFEGLNMGQEIAKIGNRVHILKRINGEPHSVGDWSYRRTVGAPITSEEASTFLGKVKEIAKFPRDSFDSYALRLKKLEDKGYKMDSFNPNNLLIDYENKQIYIIDSYKYAPDTNMNSKNDLFAPLVDYPNFDEYLSVMTDSQRQEFINASKVLNTKCTKSAKRVGLETGDEKFRDFVSRIDERNNLEGLYTSCFNSLMNHLRN